MQDRLQLLIDKAEIVEVVQSERAARDQSQWDKMRAAYHDDSIVDLSWFIGSGPEFVIASRRRFLDTKRHSAHIMGSTLVSVKGSRALAQTTCAVCVRTLLHGVEVEITAHSRLHERLEKRDGIWRLSRLGIVYLRDILSLVNPASKLEIDNTRLATYRLSYRYLSYFLALTGASPRMDLPGVDQPETVEPLLTADEAWLAGGA